MLKNIRNKEGRFTCAQILTQRCVEYIMSEQKQSLNRLETLTCRGLGEKASHTPARLPGSRSHGNGFGGFRGRSEKGGTSRREDSIIKRVSCVMNDDLYTIT